MHIPPTQANVTSLLNLPGVEDFLKTSTLFVDLSDSENISIGLFTF